MSPSLFIASLLVTTFIEGLVARAFGLKEKHTLLIVLLVNAITNPVLNYLIWININFFDSAFRFSSVLVAEVVVVLVEWMLLVYSFNRSKWRLFTLSLVMNTASFFLGFIFYMTFGLFLGPLAKIGL